MKLVMRSMRYLRRRPLVTYFFLAVVISSLMWLPLVFHHTTSDATPRPLWWLHYAGGLGPALAAVITSLIVGGRKELTALAKRLCWQSAAAKWIVLGALLPWLLLAGAAVVVGLATGHWLAFGELWQTAKLPGVGLLGILCFEIIFFGFGEEIGWRGFAWPRLRQRFGFGIASFLVTIPWALWHTMTFLYNDNMLRLGVGGTVGWFFSLLTGSIVVGWLVDRARGNVLPAVLFHGLLDVVFVSRAVAGHYDTALGVAIMVVALAIVVLEKFRQKPSLQHRRS